ncbi:PAAR domain-containing protein [Pseudomonas sp. S2_C03]
MNEGYFIGKGDKTTCGGVVMDGNSRINMHGLLQSFEGDRVSCGVDGQTYGIVGGIPFMSSNGRRMAGTLHSASNCPCKAQLVPSLTAASYRTEGRAAQPHSRATQSVSPIAVRHTAAPPQSTFAAATRSTPATFGGPAGQKPGFYIVPKSTTRQALEATLFPSPDAAVMNKFRTLNPGREDVKAGSMIVLSDPNNFQCTREEAWLMEAAAKTQDALKTLSADEADFMARHYAEISTFLSHGSTGVGLATASFASHLKNVEFLLKDMESLHHRSFQTHGHLRSPEFFAERQRLLKMLDNSLNGLTKISTGFPDHPNLKSALGISTKSLVHQWAKAGVAGQIPGYATHLEGVAKASRYVQYGGWIGTAIGGGASYMKVQDVCTAGDAQACERVKFTEAGSFLGGVVGSAAVGGVLGGGNATILCIALGVPTGGVATVACGLAAVGIGALAGGTIVGMGGGYLGELIYETVQ